MSRAAAQPKLAVKPISYLAFLEGSDFCGLTLSPAMAAIAAASEGAPVGEHVDEATCVAIFGCAPDALPTVPRRTVGVSAGGRGGKTSRLIATKALHAAWTVPLPNLARGERARAVIISPDRDLAEQALDYARGYVEASPVLSRAQVVGTRGPLKTRVRLRRPDGHEVDIVVGAASRGGKAARARCLVFLGLDEAAFFFADEGHAVTDREIYRAGIMRVVPGGQVWIVSTPWIAEQGILEERITSETYPADHPRAGERRHAHSLTVARVGTRMLNPEWDPDGSIERDMRESDPENAEREIDAIPLAAGTAVFFDPEAVRRMFELPAFPGSQVGIGVGGDFGFTNDCSAAVGTRRLTGDAFDTFDAYERRPTRGQPLKPSEAIGGAAQFTLRCGAKQLAADGHYKESSREHLHAAGVSFVEAPSGNDGKVDTYTAARAAMNEGRVRCSIADPTLRARLREQLRSITRKPLPGGGVAISAPRRRPGPTGQSGGHGDLVSGWVLSLWRCGAGRAVATAESVRVLRGRATRWRRGGMGRGEVNPRTGRPTVESGKVAS